MGAEGISPPKLKKRRGPPGAAGAEAAKAAARAVARKADRGPESALSPTAGGKRREVAAGGVELRNKRSGERSAARRPPSRDARLAGASDDEGFRAEEVEIPEFHARPSDSASDAEAYSGANSRFAAGKRTASALSGGISHRLGGAPHRLGGASHSPFGSDGSPAADASASDGSDGSASDGDAAALAAADSSADDEGGGRRVKSKSRKRGAFVARDLCGDGGEKPKNAVKNAAHPEAAAPADLAAAGAAEAAADPAASLAQAAAFPAAAEKAGAPAAARAGGAPAAARAGGDAPTFESLGLCPELTLACRAIGWSHPTPIQAEVLPPALAGRDIIALAETGSGKTGAFALPVIDRLLAHPLAGTPYCLVLTPTRELAAQIADQFRALGAAIAIRVCTVLGGVDLVQQALDLARRPHVIVATPGRIVDHIEHTKGFSIASLRFLVLDEADRLLSMDFEEQLDVIVAQAPKTRNTYLFSATMTSKVSKLQRASLSRPVRVELGSKYATVKNLVQFMKFLPYQRKWTFAAALVAHLQNYSTIVFVNTCLDAQRLAKMLSLLGHSATSLHGKMAQAHRLHALTSFRAAQASVLVATEVGSRGLDIPHVDVVVNFDVPLSGKDYVHRVGRTARAGRDGRAVTLVTQYDIEAYQAVEQALGKKLPVYNDLPDDRWLALHEKATEAKNAAFAEVVQCRKPAFGGQGKKRKRRA